MIEDIQNELNGVQARRTAAVELYGLIEQNLFQLADESWAFNCIRDGSFSMSFWLTAPHRIGKPLSYSVAVRQATVVIAGVHKVDCWKDAKQILVGIVTDWCTVNNVWDLKNAP